MSKFIKFDNDIVVNIDRIDGFFKDRTDNTAIYVSGSDNPFHVPESVEEVLSKINTEIYSYRISL